MSGFGKNSVFTVLVLFLLNVFHLSGQVAFSSLDISDDDRLLFRLGHSAVQGRDALFSATVPGAALRQLTVFPERMDLIENGRTLQIRNSLGTVRLPSRGGLPPEGTPAFLGGALPAGRLEETVVSPNGRWALLINPETHAYGTLVLRDIETGIDTAIASGVERPDTVFSASWSPDSRFFVYVRQGRLYYCPVNSAPPIDEKFRYIGEGTINSIVWKGEGDFFYLHGSTVYRVRGMELFTRTLYADFLEIGSIVGKIPFEFDPYFDLFWIAPDSRSLLLSKGGRNIIYYPLENDDYSGPSSGLPYLVLPRSSFDVRALWPEAGGITVLASVPGQERLLAWRLDTTAENKVFTTLAAPSGLGLSLSPDGKTALFWGKSGVALLDYASWTLLETISYRPAYSCLWAGANEIIIGDEARIERVILSPDGKGRITRRELICLSGAAQFGFETGAAPRILAQNHGTWFVTDGKTPWAEIVNPRVRSASQASSRYRVYLERQSSGFYTNIPMVRNIASVGTFPLLKVSGTVTPILAQTTAPGSPFGQGIFSRGNPGISEISLCFDLYDDAEGLSDVLYALDRFNVKATFFLGGEFIRRYPAAARDIAAAGHEAASLFFAQIDLSDSRYRIDTDFITRGLARNEDEYFNATGRELALLWHPPWYAVSSAASFAAASAGYITVGRGIDTGDWVSRADEKQFGLPQFSAADMIDRVMKTAGPGSIIPVRLGLLPGGRTDYLFQRINVLLDALVSEGYRPVTVSELVNHAR